MELPFADITQFGFSGVLLVVVVWQIKFSDKRDRSNVDRLIEVIERNNKVMDNVREVVAGFKEVVRRCDKK